VRSGGLGLSAEVFGRGHSVAQLEALIAGTALGRGAVVVMEGEPGIGKTTILDAVVDLCAHADVRVWRGAAEELELRLPFAAVGSCLTDIAVVTPDRVARVKALMHGDEGFDAAGGANHEFMVVEAILDLVDERCATGPHALLLDDLQWADGSSILVLHRLARMVEQMPLLIVLTCRTVPRSPELEALLRGLDSRAALSLVLGPLDGDAVETLVTDLAGAKPAPDLMTLVAGTAGNPMYVRELISALTSDGSIVISGEHARLTSASHSLALPSSLSGMIQRRLGFLSPSAREMLTIAAALGEGMDVAGLAKVLDKPVPILLRSVSEAVKAGLLSDAGETLDFRHDLIRQVLADGMPRSSRNALRLHAGQILAHSGAPVERVAEYLLAGTSLDPETVDWLVASAERLIVRAPQLAVDLLGRVVAATDPQDPRDEILRVHLARALLWAGRVQEAESVVRGALARASDPATVSTLHWLLAQTAFQQGNVEEGAAVARAALQSPLIGPADAGRFHGFLSHCVIYLGEIEASLAEAELAIVAGEASGDTYAIAYGLYNQATIRFLEQRPVEALSLADRAISVLGSRRLQPDLQMSPHLSRGWCLQELDRLAEADAAFEAGRRESELAGSALLNWHHAAKTRLRLVAGRWDDAIAEIRAGLEAVDSLGVAGGLHRFAALIAIHRGDLETYSDLVEETDTSLGGRYWDHVRVWARALTWEARGQQQEAFELLLQSWNSGVINLPQALLHYLCADMARLAQVLGEWDSLRLVAADLERLAARQPSLSIRATAALCRGVAEADPVRIEDAVDAYGKAGRPIYRGHALESQAIAFAHLGRPAEARAALSEAIVAYDRVEAVWDSHRAESRLRRVGVRRAVRGPHQRAKHGWDALTDTEGKVAALVALGHSNPAIASELFVSRRTIQSHVSSILMKLDLDSRVQIAVMSANHSPTPPIAR
jgi:DNA-binding CsgD family transcriptional regulator